VAGDRPVDRRRRATAAAVLTGGRVQVRPWGAAGYVVRPPTGPAQTCDDLDGLAARLWRHVRRPPPVCRTCSHPAEQVAVALTEDCDRQRLVVELALARHAARGRLDLTVGDPRHVHLTGPHAAEHAAALGACSAGGAGPLSPRRGCGR
jgi:hypothetical protein